MPILNQLTRDALLDRTMDAANQAELISDMGAAKAHLLVADNDAKQLLTSLSDGQEVEVTGEAGRIERYNGDNAGLATVFSISSAGSPTSSVSDGESSLALTYSVGVSLDYEDSSGNAWVDYDGTRWTIGYQMYPFFRSAVCASSVHPADATGWEAYDAGGGIGLGTIADVTGVTALPEATESNWSDIISSAYVSFNNLNIAGSLIEVVLNEVTYSWASTEGVGWMREGQILEASSSSMTINSAFAITEIDTVVSFAGKNQIPTSGTASGNVTRTGYLTLPPKARLVTISGH